MRVGVEPASTGPSPDDRLGASDQASRYARGATGPVVVTIDAAAHELGARAEDLERFLEESPRLVEVDGRRMVQLSGGWPRPTTYSPAEAAAALGVSLPTIYRRMDAGDLGYTQLPLRQAERRISAHDLLAHLLREGGAAQTRENTDSRGLPRSEPRAARGRTRDKSDYRGLPRSRGARR